MNWNVTYRKKDGGKAVKEYVATSREELFACLALEGVAILSVEQKEQVETTKNILNSKFKALKKNPTIFLGLVILILGLTIALGVLFSRSEKTNVESNATQKTKKPLRTALPIQSNDTEQVSTRKQPLGKDKRYDIKGNIVNVPKNPWGQPIPPELEYKPIWEYTTEDYAKVDPGYLKRHKAHLKRQAAIPWKTDADRQLAILLFAKDGNTGLLPPFNRRFVDQFLKSIETPIVATQEDSPELQEQKRQMNEVKLYLKERLDAGDDIVEILNEEYKNAKKVHALRQNLQEELRRLEKAATSVEEVQDYINAANKMLDEYGAKHVGLPLTLTRLRLEKSAASDNE